jgi:hypothetical protein
MKQTRRQYLNELNAKIGGEIMTELLREIDPGFTEDETKRLIAIRLRRVGAIIDPKKIKFEGFKKLPMASQSSRKFRPLKEKFLRHSSGRKIRTFKEPKNIILDYYSSKSLGDFLGISSVAAYLIMKNKSLWNPVQKYSSKGKPMYLISHLEAKRMKHLLLHEKLKAKELASYSKKELNERIGHIPGKVLKGMIIDHE